MLIVKMEEIREYLRDESPLVIAKENISLIVLFRNKEFNIPAINQTSYEKLIEKINRDDFIGSKTNNNIFINRYEVDYCDGENFIFKNGKKFPFRYRRLAVKDLCAITYGVSITRPWVKDFKRLERNINFILVLLIFLFGLVLCGL